LALTLVAAFEESTLACTEVVMRHPSFGQIGYTNRELYHTP
jgi:hypothetical protein